MPNYKKVNKGEDLNIPADTYNAFIDAANFVKTMTTGGAGDSGGGGSVDDTTTVKVKNISGQVIKRYHAITLKVPAVLPADGLAGFKSRIQFRGEVPAAGYERRWGILQENVSDGIFGSVVVSGVTIAWINLTDVAHKYVEIEAATDILKSGTSGYGTILWVLGGVGSASGTGNQWAVIRLDNGGIGVGQYQYMTYQVVAQNKGGWDFVMASPALP